MTAPTRLPDGHWPVKPGLIHAAARHVANLLPGAQVGPLRDAIGVFAYEIRADGVGVIVCAKRSSRANLVGINREILLQAQAAGLEVVLALYSGASRPQLLTVDTDRALSGPTNRANRQVFCHTPISSLRPWVPPAQGEPVLP